MTRKQKEPKRPRAGATRRRRKSVLASDMPDHPVDAQTKKPWIIDALSFLRFMFTTRDIRSFQIYMTKSGCHTVYLKDIGTSTRQT
jgi:hypothetical protein